MLRGPVGSMSTTINRFFDALPRPRIFRGCAERPAFRSLGVAGYHAALVATFGAGLLAGRSLLVLAAVAAVCAGSFFAWAYVRRAIGGSETLVLLEHVWLAALAAAGTLHLLGEPILPYLDAVSVGLAVFLAFGRAGCLLVGCWHGHPSSSGVRYGGACARDGFPAHLVGVRLFPVQAIELLGLAGIALGGLLSGSGPEPGRALIWFLVAYAVLRFGLEGLRADERPHLLGLSQARWMALGELGVALALGERWRSPPRVAALGILVATLVVALILARRFDPRRRLLAPAHLAELRALVRASLAHTEATGDSVVPIPEVRRTSLHVSASVSVLAGGNAGYVSLALPLEDVDLRLLCDVMAGALPEVDPLTGRTRPASLLHAIVPLPLGETPARSSAAVARGLYGVAARRIQLERDGGPAPVVQAVVAAAPVVDAVAAVSFAEAVVPAAPITQAVVPAGPATTVPEIVPGERSSGESPPAAASGAAPAGRVDGGEPAWEKRHAASAEPWRRVKKHEPKPADPPEEAPRG